MRESFDAACGRFEQVILSQMLRSANIGKAVDLGEADADGCDDRASGEAYQQLFVQALSSALERAGGIGLARAMRAALAEKRL